MQHTAYHPFASLYNEMYNLLRQLEGLHPLQACPDNTLKRITINDTDATACIVHSAG